jgi:hypothetical protein
VRSAEKAGLPGGELETFQTSHQDAGQPLTHVGGLDPGGALQQRPEHDLCLQPCQRGSDAEVHVVGTVREAIKDLTGPERVVTATLLALQRMHSDPLVQLMPSTRLVPGSEWLTTSPVVADFAAEMVGEDNPDPLAAQWLIRVFMALWCWPLNDPAAERAMVQRFLGRSYGDSD